MANNSDHPGFRGAFEGIKSFFRNKPSLPAPEAPDREVRDVGTIVRRQGPRRLHRQISSAPLFQDEEVKRQSRHMHQYGYGYVAGTFAASLVTNALLYLGAKRVPALRKHASKLTLTNTMHSLYIMSQMPNQLNRKLRELSPPVHQGISDELHSEAEELRKKKT